MTKSQAPLTTQVYDEIFMMILRHQLKPFQRISEAGLSQTLGVSRTPVREALLRLSLLGFVEILPQRGTFIAPLRMKDLRLSQFMREALELSVINRLFDLGTVSEALPAMKREIMVQEAMLSNPDTTMFNASDENFHEAIATAAHVPGMLPEIRRLRGAMDRFRYLTVEGIDDLGQVVAQHREIAQAFEKRDRARAITAMKTHLRRILDYCDQARQAHPEYFDEAGETLQPV